MEFYANKVTLKGFVGKDAESFATKQQRTLVVFSLATKSGYKNKQTNEWVNRTEWHRIVAFGKPVDDAKGLKKGDYVEVEGEMQSTERPIEVIKDKKKTEQEEVDVNKDLTLVLLPPRSGERFAWPGPRTWRC